MYNNAGILWAYHLDYGDLYSTCDENSLEREGLMIYCGTCIILKRQCTVNVTSTLVGLLFDIV